MYTSEGGVLDAVSEGTLIMDCSTIDPSVAREVAAAATAGKVQPVPHSLKTPGMAHSPSSLALTQARMVDAPVSGGVGGAEAATLTFMVGGR